MNLKTYRYLTFVFSILLLQLYACGGRNAEKNQILEARQKKFALLIGMRKTNVKGFSNVATMSSSSNIKRIKRILKKEDFEDIETIENPNDAKFLTTLSKSLNNLGNNDFLVVYYFGHGGQIEDDVSGYDIEPDGLDETFVTFNRQIRDDEVHHILKDIKTSAKVLFIVDACNSQSSITFLETVPHNMAIDDALDLNLLYMGATADGKRIPPDTFSKIIEKAWKKGKFKGSYLDFHNEVSRRASAIRGMSPVLDTRWADKEFINQRPFKTN